MEDKTVITTAPPPPSEVKIRTMRSDLKSMAASGGGMPKFQSVAVSGLSIEKEYKEEAAAAVAANKKNIIPMLIVGIVAVLAICGVGYVAYVMLFSGSASQSSSTQNSGATSPTSTPSQSSNTPPAAGSELSSPHISLFQKSADQIITEEFTSTGYQQSMLSALAAASGASTIIEMDPKSADGSNISIQGLLSDAGAPLFNSQTLSGIDPDATLFVYRDKNGLWPGYVIALNAGQSSSSLESVIQQQIESSSNLLGKLFLTSVGTPSSGGFVSGSISNIQVRTLSFAGSYVPVSFVYGWSGNDLIMSTSQNGFAAAAAAL